MPNNLSQFWQELKRRKVIRVITVYAASAFVILELVDIITEPFGLPDWTLKLVVVLLTVGLIVSVILSWIYDVTPEGIQKTRPIKHTGSVKGPDTSLGWKISTFVSSLIIIAFVLFYVIGSVTESRNIFRLEKSIAVLPFENWSYDEEFSHLGFAIANEIITELYKVTEFRVLSHTSTIQYADTKKTIPVIGEELGANYLIEGIVERQENRVNIHVQVIRAKNEDHIWADEFEGEWKDIFSIQDDIALRVAEELQTVLSTDEKEKISKKPTDNSEAYNLYLRGRYFWNQRTEDGLLKAREHYEEAIDIDPQYALAYSGLADSYILLPYYTDILPVEANPRSMEFALKAVALDNSLAESYTSLAQSKTLGEWDWTGAMEEFRKAIDLDPNYSIAHHWYSNCLMYVGRFDESLREIEIALELDPLSLIINRDLGELYFYNRQYSKAKEQYQRTIDIDPDFSLMHLDMGRVYLMERMYDDALREFQTDSLEIWTGITLALMGRVSEAQVILEDLATGSKSDRISRYQLSLLCFALEQEEQGFSYLREAYETHNTWMMFLKIEPLFDSIRSDPRFAEFLQKTSLQD